MSYRQTSPVSPDELERLLHYMPSVCRMTDGEWARGFAASIIKQSKRPNWRPSQKQLPIMRELVGDLFLSGGNEGGDFSVVE